MPKPKLIPRVGGTAKRVLVRRDLLNELIDTANAFRSLSCVGGATFDIADANAVLTIEGAAPGSGGDGGADASISGHIEVPANGKEYTLCLHTQKIVVTDARVSLLRQGVVSTSDPTPNPLYATIAAVRGNGEVIVIAAGMVNGDVNTLRPSGSIVIPEGCRLYLKVTAGGWTSAPVWSTTLSKWVQATGSAEGGDYAEADIATDLQFTITAVAASAKV